MSALNRKLLRDLWRLRGQVLAIALVLGSGVGLLVMSFSAIEALDRTAEAYYERYRFADVFASLKRAPRTLERRIAEIPGARTVETRIVKLATVDVPGFGEPVTAELVSIPERRAPPLNALAIQAGRSVAPGNPDEVVLSEPFAEAHELVPGDTVEAVINGRKRFLDVVGVALSPEFVYSIGPGALMPDNERFGVFWMGREALAAAFDMEGAFNNVALALLPGARAQDVIDRLDGMLARYGGTGAYDRGDQVSNWFLMNEIAQLRTLSGILPTIFIAVSAFLANMVIGRLISTERSEIGLMKAFGYSNGAIAWHYLKLVMAMAVVGIVLGWAVGYGLGRYSSELYAEFYRFPFLFYRPSIDAFAVAALVSVGAALLGSINAVRRAAALPPAEAMRPPPPPVFRRGALGGAHARRWLDQPTRMILRQIGRWPGRAGVTALGIALSIGVVVSSAQWWDAINRIVEIYFFQTQGQTMTVGLVEARSSTVMHEIERLPGVLAVEPMRFVRTRLHAGPRTHREAIQGIPPDARLSVLQDADGSRVSVPREGLLLSTRLAEKLRVGAGDMVTVEVLEGRRPEERFPVAGLIETHIGMPAYMSIAALNRLMRERPAVNAVHVLSDPADRAELLARLQDLPQVSVVTIKDAAVDMFYDTMADTILIYISFFVVFACALAGGVVYNSARIALSERGRELATLRVLGFTRGEISYILLGEVAFLTFAALPAGCLIGHALAWVFAESFDTELYRVPLVVEPSTYGVAMAVGLAAATGSAALVRRRLDRLDLIAVLKTRE